MTRYVLADIVAKALALGFVALGVLAWLALRSLARNERLTGRKDR